MPDILQQGYTQSVRCLICARPARRGATLCAQCKAAVRRARHEPSVNSQYLPHAKVVRTDTRRSVERTNSYSRSSRRASSAPAAPALGGWGTYATIIAFGLAVCLTGYLAMSDKDRFYLGRAEVTVPPPVTARDDIAVKARAPLPSLAMSTEPEFSYEVADEHLAIFESLTPPPRAVPDRKAAREGKGSKGIRTPRVATHARSAGSDVAPLDVTSMPLNLVAATALVYEPAAPDRWQQFASAVARCERENVIAGLVCKERARLQYCEGEWGVAPQCPAAVASLNTR